MKHVYLEDERSREEEYKLLTKVSEKCMERGLAIISPPYLDAEREMPRPSLRVCASAALGEEDVEFAVRTLQQCLREALLENGGS